MIDCSVCYQAVVASREVRRKIYASCPSSFRESYFPGYAVTVSTVQFHV